MPWTVYDSSGNILSSIALTDNSVTNAKMADDAIDSAELAAGSVDLAHMSAESVDSDQYLDGSIDRVHLAADIVDGTKIADDVIDSEHYAAASIDNEHLADDAVGVAELSATGTASSSTFLRGDNAWAAAGGGAVTRAGGNDSEGGMSSTTAAEILAATSLSIGAEVPIIMMVNARKSAGGGEGGEVGFTMNAVTVCEPAAAVETLWSSGGQNEAQDGGFVMHLLPRATNYQQGVLGFFAAHKIGGSIRGSRAGGFARLSASMPIATINDMDIRAVVASGGNITVSVDHYHLYTVAIS